MIKLTQPDKSETIANSPSFDRPAEYARLVLEGNREKCWKGCGIPLKHQTRAESNQVNTRGPWGQALHKLIAKLAEPEGSVIVLIGPPGTGKTQMAIEAMRQAIWLMPKPSARYCEAIDIFMKFRSAFAQRGSDERSVLESFTRPKLLIVDDIHRRNNTTYEDTMIEVLINKRYGAMRSTLLISNETQEQFQASYAGPIISRIKESGGIIQCDWNDFRDPHTKTER